MFLFKSLYFPFCFLYISHNLYLYLKKITGRNDGLKLGEEFDLFWIIKYSFFDMCAQDFMDSL